ncbi:MAG: hypothetical protein Kow00109_15870 [Acidobacteriota bacterium]
MKIRMGIAVGVFALLAGEAAGQDPYEHESWKNGYFATATYGGVPGSQYYSLDVNAYTGGYTLVIPVLSLPGRAGHGVELVLSYGSRQFYLEPWTQYGWSGYYYQFYVRSYLPGPHCGRWHLNIWPMLKAAADGQSYYFTTPDGAVHHLHQPSSGWLVATDGSDLAYHSGRQHVAYPDGRYFDFSEYASQHRVQWVDRNGNRITYEFEHYGYDRWRPVRLIDTLGRVITFRYEDPEPTYVTAITVTNHAGAELTWRLEYQDVPADFQLQETYGNGNRMYFNAWNTVLPGRVLAALRLPNQMRYQFQYQVHGIRYRDAHWHWYERETSTYQLEQVELPTGAKLRFGYRTPPTPGYPQIEQYPSGGPTAHDEIELYAERLSRRVASITVDLLDGRPLETTYRYEVDAFNRVLQTTETRPDGSRVVTVWHAPGEDFAHLRRRQERYDTDGTTLLQQVETTWTTTPYGTRAAVEEVWEGALVRQIRRVYDGWGRLVEEHVAARYPSGGSEFPGPAATGPGTFARPAIASTCCGSSNPGGVTARARSTSSRVPGTSTTSFPWRISPVSSNTIPPTIQAGPTGATSPASGAIWLRKDGIS